MSTASMIQRLADGVGAVPPPEVIFGQSAAMQEIREKLEKVADANVPVLIMGESGTGKEIIAKLVHRYSSWSNGPFVKVSCPAVPGTLVESELFGYERGAFTGAYGAKPGRVEMAHRGTLFLDEIGEMDIGLQAKLLQLLQDSQFCRIGATEDKKIEVRVVCATNRNLEEEVQEGSFRQDLFYRINVVSVNLPPLRERINDIPILIDHFLQVYNEQFNRRVAPPSKQFMQVLRRYTWPGNIRELENVMKRYVILRSEEEIAKTLVVREEDAFSAEFPDDGSMSLKKLTRDAVRKFERDIMLKVLQDNHWNRRKAAHTLQISYRALLYKLKEAGLKPHREPLHPPLPDLGAAEAAED